MTGYELTEQHIREIREQGDLKEFLASLRTEATAACSRRRSMVLAHPDLAEQLTTPPCAFATPQMWTGYIGPALIDVDRHGTGTRNESPYRAQLLALVAEAEQRTRTERAA